MLSLILTLKVVSVNFTLGIVRANVETCSGTYEMKKISRKAPSPTFVIILTDLISCKNNRLNEIVLLNAN